MSVFYSQMGQNFKMGENLKFDGLGHGWIDL